MTTFNLKDLGMAYRRVKVNCGKYGDFLAEVKAVTSGVGDE